MNLVKVMNSTVEFFFMNDDLIGVMLKCIFSLVYLTFPIPQSPLETIKTQELIQEVLEPMELYYSNILQISCVHTFNED